MVEFGRLAQVDRLVAQGWYTDDETERFDQMEIRDEVVGAPTYLKNPNDHRLYACSGGTERLVEGRFALLIGPGGRKIYTGYSQGKATWTQG